MSGGMVPLMVAAAWCNHPPHNRLVRWNLFSDHQHQRNQIGGWLLVHFYKLALGFQHSAPLQHGCVGCWVSAQVHVDALLEGGVVNLPIFGGQRRQQPSVIIRVGADVGFHQLELGTDQFDGWIEVEVLVRVEVASGVEGRSSELQYGLRAQRKHIFDGRQPFRERGGGGGWVGVVVGGEELVVVGAGGSGGY